MSARSCVLRLALCTSEKVSALYPGYHRIVVILSPCITSPLQLYCSCIGKPCGVFETVYYMRV